MSIQGPPVRTEQSHACPECKRLATASHKRPEHAFVRSFSSMLLRSAACGRVSLPAGGLGVRPYAKLLRLYIIFACCCKFPRTEGHHVLATIGQRVGLADPVPRLPVSNPKFAQQDSSILALASKGALHNFHAGHRPDGIAH